MEENNFQFMFEIAQTGPVKDKFGYPGVHKRSVKSVLENLGLYQVPRKSAIR
jgi:hypothetical protein